MNDENEMKLNEVEPLDIVVVEEGPEDKPSFISKVWDVVWLPLLVFILVSVLFRTVILNGYVPSESMETTISKESWVLGNRLSVMNTDKIKRYDVIVFKAELVPGFPEHVVKRVIGLPGDEITITEDKILVNGQEVIEDFVSSVDNFQKPGNYTVPLNGFFVAGDNRANSNDSRKWTYKFVDDDSIVAKAWANYWFFGFETIKKYDDNIK